MERRPGRAARWLAAAGVAALLGCGDGDGGEVVTADGDPHVGIECAACHAGPGADRSLASVPAATCTTSGCHDDGAPEETEVGRVAFTHREHGLLEEPAVGCAGCHTHPSGDEPLRAGGSTCGLCHQEELTGGDAQECRSCHTLPTHIGFTSQEVPVPHADLPWIEDGCLRCHYDVSDPLRAVPLRSCADCHEDAAELGEALAEEELHPSHTGVSCTACHAPDTHRIAAMSTAVGLQCAGCHLEEHGVDPGPPALPTAACNQCHAESHRENQRLLLGLALDDAVPAPHFSDGLTCRSCHGDPGTATENRPRTTADACVDCHRPEYGEVLDWWREGVGDRSRMVEGYLSRAESALGPGAAGLAEARGLLELVREGTGAHNLPLTHRLFRAALARAAEAYEVAGRRPPRPPGLGRAPREGLCTYCHYRVNEPGLTEEMDDAFHRAVMGR